MEKFQDNSQNKEEENQLGDVNITERTTWENNNFGTLYLVTVTQILEGKIRRLVKNKLSEVQTPIRKDRSTSDDSVILRNIIDNKTKKEEENYIALLLI